MEEEVDRLTTKATESHEQRAKGWKTIANEIGLEGIPADRIYQAFKSQHFGRATIPKPGVAKVVKAASQIVRSHTSVCLGSFTTVRRGTPVPQLFARPPGLLQRSRNPHHSSTGHHLTSRPSLFGSLTHVSPTSLWLLFEGCSRLGSLPSTATSPTAFILQIGMRVCL